MTVLADALKSLFDDKRTGSVEARGAFFFIDATTRQQWPDAYKKDKNYESGPDETWADRLSFRPKEAEGIYVMYSKEMPMGDKLSGRGWGEKNVGDYMVFGYYESEDDYYNGNFDAFDHISRSRGGFDWAFQRQYLAETHGDFSEVTWGYIKDWVKAQGHTVNPLTITDWNDTEAKRKGGGNGTALRGLVADLYHDPGSWDDASPGEMAVDLGLIGEKKAGNPNKVQKVLKKALDDPAFDWKAAQVKALAADWDVYGWNDPDEDGDDGEGDSSPANPTNAEGEQESELERLLRKATDLSEMLYGEETTDELEWPNDDEIEQAANSGDLNTLRDQVDMLEIAVKALSKDKPRTHVDDDVEVLPPGTEQDGGTAAGPEDTEARVPVTDTSHPRPGEPGATAQEEKDAPLAGFSDAVDDSPPAASKTPALSGGDSNDGQSAEDRLQDLCSSLRSKKGGTRLKAVLGNEIEFKLKKVGEDRYDVTCESWLTDDEFDQFLSAAGIVATKAKTKIRSGFGKKWLTFEKDSDGEYDVAASRPLSMDEAVAWIGHMARVNTDGQTDEAAEDDGNFVSILDGLAFTDIPAPGSIDEEEMDNEDEYGDSLMADEWHDLLVGELGMERTSQQRYTRPGKDGKPIVCKLTGHSDDMLDIRGFKEVVLLHGSKKILTYEKPDDLYGGVRMLLPKHENMPVERGGGETAEGAGTTQEDTGLTIFDDIYIVQWSNVDFLALDSEGDNTSFLTAHGFVWHPPIFTFAFRSKAKGLKVLDRIKAGGIEIINEDEIVTAVNGRKVKPTPFSKVMRTQAKEQRRKAKDMAFTVHLSHDDEGKKVLMVTTRKNNRKAEVVFKRARWQVESAGYWMPIKGKAAAKKVLKALHKDGVRLGDVEDFEERWTDAYGGKVPADFSVTSSGPAPKKPAKGKKAPKGESAGTGNDHTAALRGAPARILRLSPDDQGLAIRVKSQYGEWPPSHMNGDDMLDALDSGL